MNKIRLVERLCAPGSRHVRTLAILSACALLAFIATGVLLAPLAGFQGDEVSFIYNLWHPETGMDSISVFHQRIPLMMMTYLGSMKGWVFAPVFHLFGVSEWSVRIPSLFLASITIVLGGLLVKRSGGRLGQLIFIFLLSTDITFLVTAVFDWGPVVIQNLLLVAGMLCFSAGWANQRKWMLLCGGLLFGMALWDKALFLWNMIGMLAALLIVHPKALFRTVIGKGIWLALMGLMIGASPLLHFNARTGFATMKDNTRLTFRDVAAKAEFLKFALDGTASQNPFADGHYWNQGNRASLMSRIFPSRAEGKPMVIHSWRWWLLFTAIPLGVILGSPTQRRWLLFFLISGTVAWFQSALTVGAGGSIHHSVLIWPFLYGAISLSFSSITQFRSKYTAPIVLAATLFFVLRGILMLGLAHENMSSTARDIRWTDADTHLREQLLRQNVRRAICADWGIAWVVTARTEDRVAVSDLFFDLARGQFDPHRFVNCREPDCIVIDHVKDRSLDSAAYATIEASLTSLGLERMDRSIVRDGRNNPIFELYRIRRADENIKRSR